ncbi:hypothetical protein [Streptomyces sp. NPDC127072]|uniref:hypothetical protein n=1 Tax=Streptomyces sp. NPDC127072 TaxID=3347129 RepID=UPI00365B7AB8
MTTSPTNLALLTLALLVSFLLALLVAVTAGLLARWDGATPPAALLRAGIAFGGALTLLTAVVALVTGIVT